MNPTFPSEMGGAYNVYDKLHSVLGYDSVVGGDYISIFDVDNIVKANEEIHKSIDLL